MIKTVLAALPHKTGKLMVHLFGQALKAWGIPQRLALKGCQRHAQDACGTGVGGKHQAHLVHHDHTGAHVVQNGL